MVLHQPYYDTLAAAEETLPVWAPTLAGLAVLQLVDAARHDRSIVDADWTGVRAITEAVSGLREGSPFRRSLLTIIEQLRDGEPSLAGVTQSLFAYGRALDLDGHWSLAADVFGTVAEMAREQRDARLAIEATTALGGAARRSGDWDRSADSYASAAHLADTLGDKASGLTVQVGNANTHIARGNIPAARILLDEVVSEAARSDFPAVEAIACHARATVAHLSGEYADAVSFGYRALGKTPNASSRDSILADIAAAFAEMGMTEAARDAQLVISMTSRYQWVRWQATINLMELAGLDGKADAFDSYARELKNAALDPRLRSYYLLYYGQGSVAFSRIEEGIAAITEARDFAAENKIHQVAHEAARALETAGKRRVRRVLTTEEVMASIPQEVYQVAEAIGHLREAALSAPSTGAWSQYSSD